jgi:transmembrane sensor
MKPYESYTVEDFLENESFRKWVQGQGTQEMFWLSFLENYPDRREAFRRAEHLIRAANVAGERITEKEIRVEIERFIQKASGEEDRLGIGFSDDDEEDTGRTIFWKRWLGAAAAVLILGSGIGWYYYQNNATDPRITATAASPSNFVTTRNDTDKSLLINLNDGSEVMLSRRAA